MPLSKKVDDKKNEESNSTKHKMAGIYRTGGRNILTASILGAVSGVPVSPFVKPVARTLLVSGKALDSDPVDTNQVIADTVGEIAQLSAIGAIVTPLVTGAVAVGATLTTGPVLLLGGAVAVTVIKTAQAAEPIGDLVAGVTKTTLDAIDDMVTSERVGRSHLDDIPDVADTIAAKIKGSSHLASARSYLSSMPSAKKSSSAKVQLLSGSRQRNEKEKEYLKEQREKLDSLPELTLSSPASLSPAAKYFSCDRGSFFRLQIV